MPLVPIERIVPLYIVFTYETRALATGWGWGPSRGGGTSWAQTGTLYYNPPARCAQLVRTPCAPIAWQTIVCTQGGGGGGAFFAHKDATDETDVHQNIIKTYF